VSPTKTDLQRILDFSVATASACADEVRDAPFGCVLSTPSLPLVWSLNSVVARRPGAPLEQLVEALPDAPRPSIYFEDVDDAERLAGELAGWDTENEVYMVLAEVPPAPAPGTVREGSREEIEALDREWLVEDFSSQGERAVEQLVEYMRRQWDARPTRAFVSPDGTAMAKLWSDGTTAQVEDVYTHPDGRGQGHARALVSHIAALAASERHEVVYVVADDDNTPKQLYERLGFTPARRARRYVRPAAQAS
jgi:ribosomal protein S18 acetylase RimI-like enzyme